ncbi:glycosyltransferase family 2 protein [candidate division CSSED10-310 bacterium]|uniref:Glycosyltransferase family 2 protein n=1 Tax=candidate division CSSED10-310 bacterium TaxID=2855610 RepID=A0ABV6YWG6_UNCC1
MHISVVIPTKNGLEYLPLLLNKLSSQKPCPPDQIFAVDSGSTDGSREILHQAGVKVVSIPPASFNHGLARNRGISEAARSDIVILLSQDAVPTSDSWLHHMLAAFSDPEVAGVYCRQVPRPSADPLTRRHVEGWITGEFTARIQDLSSRAEFDNLTPFERYLRCNFDNVCSAVRRSIWQEFHFEKTYFAEDLGWSKRVLLAGYKIAYTPDAVVEHSHNRGAFYMFQRDYACHRRLFELFGVQTIGRLRDAIRLGILTAGGDMRFLITQGAFKNITLLLGVPLKTGAQIMGQYFGARAEKQQKPLPRFLKGI